MIGAIIARQAVKQGFVALNKQDIAGFMKSWANESSWIYPGTLSVSGTFTGKAAVQSWFENFCRHFTRFEFDVRCICAANIFAINGNNIIVAEWTLDLMNNVGKNYKNEGVTVLTIKYTKVILGRDYLDNSGTAEFRSLWGEA